MMLHDDIEQAIRQYELIISHAAIRTRQMIYRYGEVEALSRLMISPDLQQGFKALRDRNELQLTFEAVVVRHADTFRRQVVEAAEWRLEHPFDLL